MLTYDVQGAKKLFPRENIIFMEKKREPTGLVSRNFKLFSANRNRKNGNYTEKHVLVSVFEIRSFLRNSRAITFQIFLEKQSI